ncbi:MAG: helix-turn-helix transcriptional regulator [Acidiferrobacterales bacterium]
MLEDLNPMENQTVAQERSPTNTLAVRLVEFPEVPVGSAEQRQIVLQFMTRYRLTQAERTVLKDILLLGLSAKDSALAQNCSPGGVAAARKRIFQKMGVSSCSEVAAKLLSLLVSW